MLSSSIAAITAIKKVAGKVPRLSLAAMEFRVSDRPCSLRRSANRDASARFAVAGVVYDWQERGCVEAERTGEMDLPPKPLNRWFVLRIDGRNTSYEAKFTLQEAIWKADQLRMAKAGRIVEIVMIGDPLTA
jgi:hypothetical protein